VLKNETLNSLIHLRPYIITSLFIPTDENIELLSKGPSFCFPKTISIKKHLDFINNFIRKLQWHLALKKHTLSNKNRFGINQSNKWPSDKLLSNDIKQLSRRIFNSSLQILKNQMSHDNTIDSLSNNPDIKFTTADKGSNWVIMSTKSYNNEANKQLSNTNFYSELSRPKNKHNNAAINRLIEYLYKNKYINLSEKRFFITSKFKTRNFYLLPKIHKPFWSIPNYQPKGRPIVNCKESESYKIAIFIDYFLQPLVKLSKSYIKDTFNFIALINDHHIENENFLITIDVESLYTNVPVDGALKAIKCLFEKHPDPKRPNNAILNLLKIILLNNDFTFLDKHFIQISGVAMGQRFAPSVANIYLSAWEDNIRLQRPDFPSLWHRYIDDIFTIWPSTLENFHSFFNFINTFDNHIKLTFTLDQTSIVFLDLIIFKRSNRLHHKVFFKPTNNHSILHPSSHHPKHVFKGVVYSQIRRWASLSSFREDFDNACATVFPLWQKRGYTKTLLRHTKADVLNHLNLKTVWTHSFTPCQSCPIKHYTFSCKTLSINQTAFSIIGNFSCKTDFVIYTIFCQKCLKFYIGECINFHVRMLKHLYNIKNKCPLLVHKHFWANCSISDFKCIIIDRANSENKLKIKESHYIKKFNTRFPNGFNIIERYTQSPTLIMPFNQTSKKISSCIRSICSTQNINFKTVFTQGKSLQKHLK